MIGEAFIEIWCEINKFNDTVIVIKVDGEGYLKTIIETILKRKCSKNYDREGTYYKVVDNFDETTIEKVEKEINDLLNEDIITEEFKKLMEIKRFRKKYSVTYLEDISLNEED